MNSDWMKRTPMTRQTSTSRSQSDTTGYKANGEDIELLVRRRQTTSVDKTLAEIHFENNIPSPSLDLTADNGSTLQPRKIEKSFKLSTRPFGLNLTITETTKYQQTPVYYAVSYEFNPKQPDIVLHSGDSKNGDRLAVAYFRFSRHIRMGIGSETLEGGNGTWEEMRNTSTYLGHWRYEFEYNVPDVMDFTWDIPVDVPRTSKKFRWERTRDEIDGVKGVIEQNVGWRNYKLVEADSGQVLAVMLTSMFTGCTYKGRINLHVALPKEMEELVILTATCICEKGERRIRRYAFGHHAGGGG